MHMPPIPRFFVRWTIRLVLVAIFVGLPGGVIYLRQIGFGTSLKEQVEKALGGTSVRAEIGKLTFDPFQGFVAQKVKIRTLEGSALAEIHQVVIALSLADLVQGRKVVVESVELADTEASVPLGKDKEAPRVKLAGIEGQIVFLPDQVRVSSLSGRIQGVHFAISGLLHNPQAIAPDTRKAEAEAEKPPSLDLTRVLDFLNDCRFLGTPPQLEIEVSGDLADLSSVEAPSVRFRSGPLATSQWRIEGVEVEAVYEKNVLTVQRLEIRDRTGMLTAWATWQQGDLDFEAISTLSAEVVLGMFPPPESAGAWKMEGEIRAAARGRLGLGRRPMTFDLTGSLATGPFDFRGVSSGGVSFDFAARDGKIFARNIELAVGRGKLAADILFAPGDFRVRGTSTISPTALLPIMGENERKILKLMEFRDLPYVAMELRGQEPNFALLSGQGEMRLGRTAMRDVWMDKGVSKIEVGDKAVTYRDFTLTKDGGKGTGTLVYDAGRQEVRLENVESTLSPVDVLMWVDPRIADSVKPYRFRKPPLVKARGLTHMKDPSKNDLHLDVQAADGLEYDLLNRTLRFGRTLADVSVVGTTLNARVKSAKLMGGEVAVKADVSIDPKDPTFGAEVAVKRVNFADLTKLYFNFDTSKGVGSGSYKFTARFGQEEKMRGEGSLRVEDGNVFAIPILGPLSDIIDKIIPGAGYQNASLATTDFRIREGKITTENLEIEGAGFSLFGKGDIFFQTDRMDLSVRINARGLPGIVLFPVSKLFEYVSTGTVSDPEWRPKIIPRFGGNGER